MSFETFKTNCYYVAKKHYYGTINIVGGIIFIKKTGEKIKLLIGRCSICNRKKSVILSDNTIAAGDLGDLFRSLGKNSLKVGKKLTKNALKYSGRALDITANVASAVVFGKP